MDAGSSDDRFGRLLFGLPGEIRNNIYGMSLPERLTHFKIKDQISRQLQWLAYSPDIFAEAASLVYGNSCYYHLLKLGHSTSVAHTLADTFRTYITTTFEGQEQAWAKMERMAGPMVREIVLDVRMDYAGIHALRHQLGFFLRGWRNAFPKVRKVYVFFGPDFMLGDVGVVRIRDNFSKLRHAWVDAQQTSMGQMRDAVEELDRLCPEDCEVRWRVSAHFNVINVSALAGNTDLRRQRLETLQGRREERVRRQRCRRDDHG